MQRSHSFESATFRLLRNFFLLLYGCKRFKLRIYEIYEITLFFLKWENVFAALLEKRRQRVIEERATSKIFGTKIEKPSG
jgi:hypothetical protein